MFIVILGIFVGTVMKHLFPLFLMRVMDSNFFSVMFRRIRSRMFCANCSISCTIATASCSFSGTIATASFIFKGDDGSTGVRESSMSRFSGRACSGDRSNHLASEDAFAS